jgi:hypothetical protein
MRLFDGDEMCESFGLDGCGSLYIALSGCTGVYTVVIRCLIQARRSSIFHIDDHYDELL